MWSKFAEVQCAFAVAEVRNVTANLSQTCGFAVAEHLLQFFGICGCGIEFKFAVPSSVNLLNIISFNKGMLLIGDTYEPSGIFQSFTLVNKLCLLACFCLWSDHDSIVYKTGSKVYAYVIKIF